LVEKGVVAPSEISAAQAAVLTADLDLQIAKTELEIAEKKLKEFKEKK
jgi:outer membrane protein TolC